MLKQDSLYYFAYGSNMSNEVFIDRRKMNPVQKYNVVLGNYELVFDQKGIQYIEPCFASLRKKIGARVYGILYELTPQDAEQLHKTESAGYDIEELEISVDGLGMKKCFTYINRDSCPGRKPSQRYMNKLIKGATEHSLPETYLEELRAVETFHLPIVSNFIDLIVRLLMLYLSKGYKLKIPFLKSGAGKKPESPSEVINQ
ncbi:MAG: gamma-glutamylcyclotransferase family protein [Candidatus Electrothrix aestuarii]|uniref:Gamma-glutamylcyclotransferase family protein n=1 Tax=Candidatus Electrothrix aestuarii TaxID=3062594 RepID=A0AAU8LR19_9BACT|nr:gamma-glutamylcyclotransferase family protein [Candidatus Electrothrix aestuarii]